MKPGMKVSGIFSIKQIIVKPFCTIFSLRLFINGTTQSYQLFFTGRFREAWLQFDVKFQIDEAAAIT